MGTSSSSVVLLETTLRDGGYEVDHQLTADDTAFLTGALDGAGFRYIEVCHGNGVGSADWEAKLRPKLGSAATDEQHLEAARATAKNAKYGVLLVVGPEFTKVPVIDRMPQHGVGFVRLGLPPDVFLDSAFWLPYVERIKALGMIASINLMQTAALSVRAVADGAVLAARAGADWFYVVDSFGSMRPAETREYTHAVRDASGLVLGLHAHNNSGLAVANCLAAIEAGGTMVDSTLQGIGRATGNPQTEVMVLALQRMGHELGIDTEAVMQLGELARPLFAERGSSPLHFVSGASAIHSRALPGLEKAARERGRAFRPFVLRLGQEAARRALPVRDEFPRDVVDSVLEASPTATNADPSPAMLSWLAEAAERDSAPDVAVQAERVFVRGIRARKPSVLHLVDAAEFPFAGPLPWENGDVVGISVPIQPGFAVDLGARTPTVVVADPALAVPPAKHVFRVPFALLLGDAAAALATGLAHGEPVTVVGALAHVETALRSFGVETRDGAHVIVTDRPCAVQRGDTVVSLQRGADRTAFVDRARAAGAKVLVPLIGPQVAAWTATQLHIARAVSGVEAAGSLVPPSTAPASGEVVVDEPGAPRVVVHGAETRPYARIADLRARALLRGRASL